MEERQFNGKNPQQYKQLYREDYEAKCTKQNDSDELTHSIGGEDEDIGSYFFEDLALKSPC